MIEKGVFILLDALEILKNKGYNFVCDFVGGETTEINACSFLQEVAKRNLNETVRYHGKQFGKKKELFYQHADIFVFPTYYSNECFPLVLLEAMQYGLPIVATNQGAIAEMVEHGKTGLICQTKDAVDLAQKLRLLLDNPQLRLQYGKASCERFKSNYTLERFEECMVACLSVTE